MTLLRGRKLGDSRIFPGSLPWILLPTWLAWTCSVLGTHVGAVVLLKGVSQHLDEGVNEKKMLASGSCSFDSLLALDCFVPAMTATSFVNCVV